MFDEFLRERAHGARRAVRRRSTPVADYDEYVDGKPRYDGVRSFLAVARASSCPRARRRPARRARRSTASATARTSSCCALIREDGVEAYEGSVRYVQRGARRRACAARSCRRARTAARCSRRPGIADLFEARVDGVVADARAPARASPRPTRSSPRRARSASQPARGGGVRGRAGRRRGRARRAASASSSASTASARPTRCARTAPTSSSTTWPSCWSRR